MPTASNATVVGSNTKLSLDNMFTYNINATIGAGSGVFVLLIFFAYTFVKYVRKRREENKDTIPSPLVKGPSNAKDVESGFNKRVSRENPIRASLKAKKAAEGKKAKDAFLRAHIKAQKEAGKSSNGGDFWDLEYGSGVGYDDDDEIKSTTTSELCFDNPMATKNNKGASRPLSVGKGKATTIKSTSRSMTNTTTEEEACVVGLGRDTQSRLDMFAHTAKNALARPLSSGKGKTITSTTNASNSSSSSISGKIKNKHRLSLHLDLEGGPDDEDEVVSVVTNSTVQSSNTTRSSIFNKKAAKAAKQVPRGSYWEMGDAPEILGSSSSAKGNNREVQGEREMEANPMKAKTKSKIGADGANKGSFIERLSEATKLPDPSMTAKGLVAAARPKSMGKPTASTATTAGGGGGAFERSAAMFSSSQAPNALARPKSSGAKSSSSTLAAQQLTSTGKEDLTRKGKKVSLFVDLEDTKEQPSLLLPTAPPPSATSSSSSSTNGSGSLAEKMKKLQTRRASESTNNMEEPKRSRVPPPPPPPPLSSASPKKAAVPLPVVAKVKQEEEEKAVPNASRRRSIAKSNPKISLTIDLEMEDSC